MNSTPPLKDMEDTTRIGFFSGIRQKMLIYFGLMFSIIFIIIEVIELYGIPYTNYGGEYAQHKDNVFRSLNLVADLKKERLSRWLEERRDDAENLYKSNILKTYIARIQSIIQDNVYKGLKGDELWATLKSEKDYGLLEQQLKLLVSSHGVYDAIQIADARTGTIISSTHNADLGVCVSKKRFFKDALKPGYGEVIYINKDNVSNTLRLLICRAIILNDEGYANAILIMHINPDDFIKPLLHTGEGLGRTGEALLLNQDVIILTPLKHPLKDGSIARPLEYKIRTKPAIFAVRGEEGIIESEDYRGELVLAAFRHIRITSDQGWGMVVKRDQSEIFDDRRKETIVFIIISVTGFAFILGFSFLIAGTLSRPIRKLSRTAQLVKDGSNLNIRSQITSSDEIGILSDSFNSMIDRIQTSQQKLMDEERLVVLGKLSGSIAHEIRNPLGVIDSSAYYLKSTLKDADEKTKLHLDRITKQVMKSTAIIQSLQDLAKMKEPRKSKIDIANAIEDVINVSNIPQTVEIIMNVSKNKIFVSVDGNQIQMVFKNILINAVQAMEWNGTIWVTAEKASNNWVEVSFKDSGPGIVPEKLEKIFQPFFGTKSTGFGFGLTICQMIIEKHSGEIEARSGPGKGTTFNVRLPFDDGR